MRNKVFGVIWLIGLALTGIGSLGLLLSISRLIFWGIIYNELLTDFLLRLLIFSILTLIGIIEVTIADRLFSR